MLARITRLFPLSAILLSALAFAAPYLFLPARELIVPLLMLVMLGMGLTLSPGDFLGVAQRPRLLVLGSSLHFVLMPLGALLASRLLGLAPDYRIGMVLVGAASSGTASNVIVYLARGNVALSVALTTLSTLLGTLLTPLITLLLVGQTVPVPVADMLLAVLQIAIAPIVIGMALRRLFGTAIGYVQPWLPLFSVGAICLIIAIIVALNRENLANAGASVALAVMLHNGFGLGAGYGLARAFRANRIDARTIAIEVGMQNSGLAVALALKFFSAAAALPGAIFSVWHNVSGSLLAGYWSARQEHARDTI
jgi:bile acid:Na+ symporter, BASS family